MRLLAMFARCPTVSWVTKSLGYPIVVPGFEWAGGQPPVPGRTKPARDCEKSVMELLLCLASYKNLMPK